MAEACRKSIVARCHEAFWRWRLGLLLLLCCDGCGRGVTGLRQTTSSHPVHGFFYMLLYDVGLAPGAELSLNISNAWPSDSVWPSNSTVLVILTSAQWDIWKQFPFRSLPGGSYSGYQVSHWRHPLHGRVTVKHRIRAAAPDRYYVGILNVRQVTMQFVSDIKYVNPGGEHLPLQLVGVPDALWASSAAFGVLIVVATFLLVVVWRRSATLLHALLVGCLLLKCLELALKSRYYSALSSTGDSPEWRYQVWQLASKLYAICEILLLLMTALGWRVLRPRLSPTELRFTLLAVCSAFGLALLQVSCDGSGSQPFVSFKLFFYLVQIVCYLVIIFAMNFNLRLIDVHLAESPVSPSIAILYQKKQAYKQFRRLFLAIVFQPSVVLWIQVSIFRQEMWWVVNALNEATTWLIYACLFFALRPAPTRRGLVELVRTLASSGVLVEEEEDDSASSTAVTTGQSEPEYDSAYDVEEEYVDLAPSFTIATLR